MESSFAGRKARARHPGMAGSWLGKHSLLMLSGACLPACQWPFPPSVVQPSNKQLDAFWAAAAMVRTDMPGPAALGGPIVKIIPASRSDHEAAAG